MFSLAENSSQIGHSYHLKAIIYFKQNLYEETIKTIENGLKELKKSKNEQYYILALLLAKTKLKLNLNTEAQDIIVSILKENNSIRSIIEADSELKQLL